MNNEQKKISNKIIIELFKNKIINEIGFVDIKGKLTIKIVAKKGYDLKIEEIISSIGKSMNIKVLFESKPFSDRLIDSFDFYTFFPEKTKNKYIYKYLPINDSLYSLLVNNTIWFGEVKNFNDPFDCRYIIDADFREKDVCRFYYDKHFNSLGIKNNIINALLFEDFSKSFKVPTFENFLNDLEEHHYANTFSKKFGISCFTERYDNILMWSHYANEFKGVCLIFDWNISSDSSFYKFSGSKIKYQNKLPKHYFIPNKSEMEATHIFYTKLKHWKYEQEIRELKYIDSDFNKRDICFDPKALIGIILGANISCLERSKLENLVKGLEKYSHVDFICSKIDLPSEKIILNDNRLLLFEKFK